MSLALRLRLPCCVPSLLLLIPVPLFVDAGAVADVCLDCYGIHDQSHEEESQGQHQAGEKSLAQGWSGGVAKHLHGAGVGSVRRDLP